ncbi:permease prefix domain 1-containing protein [Haploplasma axanthum]|uniref:Uncharacterized protein n=1 Tax=Haploplasma axanthum TaxID=29552 RepID=A0A449BBX8_HAPAX|nr:permease prefix domain 1-containing protein [Haploplasma axanthum]VEU79938.1 Uncharacterised protein [Haploplasma axanthum]
MNKTLEVFIENLFLGIEQTEEIKRIKKDITISTDEKYLDLISDGLTNNEAIGQIISEFGSIDEILEELKITSEPDEDLIIIDETYLKKQYKNVKLGSLLIGLATFLLLTLLGSIAYIDEANIITTIDQGTIFLIGLVVPIALYISGGLILGQTSLSKSNDFKLEIQARNITKNLLSKINSKFIFSIILGVSLCILGVAFFSISSLSKINNSSIFYIVGFASIGLGVMALISISVPREYLSTLLEKKKQKNDDDEEEETITDKIIGALFIVATIIYLLLGFLKNQWGTAWIVFPITGLLTALISIFKKSDK